jgi:putative zinc finger/helix-turn-helix YgiT family protein
MTNPRPYPRKCPECGQTKVNRAFVARDVSLKYDGTHHAFHIGELPVSRCDGCGAITEGIDTEQAIDRALRRHLLLLSPEEIRYSRSRLGLTQQHLAYLLGCASESLSRWESGHVVQSRAYDRLLRAFFCVRQLRDYLSSLLPSYGPELALRSAAVGYPVPFGARYSRGVVCCPAPPSSTRSAACFANDQVDREHAPFETSREWAQPRRGEPKDAAQRGLQFFRPQAPVLTNAEIRVTTLQSHGQVVLATFDAAGRHEPSRQPSDRLAA